MSEPTPMIDVRRNSPTPARCWAVSAVLALGLPAAIWIVSKLLSLCLPGMAHGSAEQRFLLWISGPALVEWLFVLLVWLLLRARESSFAAIGVWRFGTWPGWLMALLFGALSIASNLRFLPMLHIPISQAFWPHSTFHLLTALLVGITAGFCEEVLFRAFLMTEFAEVGYGKLMQVIAPGIAFGLSHAGYLNQGLLPWLGIMLPTAFLGMIWGVAYLLGRRALVPAMVTHFLNDATALHWIAFYMMLPR